MYEGEKYNTRWFGKPDTFGWEIYPNMFEKRKLSNILKGRLRKRDFGEAARVMFNTNVS